MKKQSASKRKKDHIELTFQSQVEKIHTDKRFYYEPIMSAHPSDKPAPVKFLGKKMDFPIWISSMTGGTQHAHKINGNLARLSGEYNLGMGLGSCRSLLTSDKHLKDFQFRALINEQPFFANLGIAQVEQLVWNKQTNKIVELVKKLEADGLIVHVNPMQEWLQSEGDRIEREPIETIEKLIDKCKFPIMVKEVGQGMGPESLKQLFKLPLAGIEFAAFGGTNFAKLELLRSTENNRLIFNDLANIGHTAEEMIGFVNQTINDLGRKALCKNVVISGGIKSFLDGYYLIHKVNCNAVYGQASTFLKYAASSYEELEQYLQEQIKGYHLATHFLKVR